MDLSKIKIDIRNCDYRDLLKLLPDKSIDLICVDPPYGKINGMKLSGQKRKIDWDTNIDWNIMFEEFNRIIKNGGTIVCFGQQPTYSKMILSNLRNFKYEIIWEKNNAAQGFHANKMPLCFTENIAIFIHKENKKNKRTFNNISTRQEIDKNKYFCRWYSQQLFEFIGIKRRKIHDILGHRKLEFFFCYTGKHFGLLSKKLYEELIINFNINKWEKFITYEELKHKWDAEKHINKGVKLESSRYSQTLSNILKISKDSEYLHPTQKPVELMEKLILMFSNENDIVLDCFLGSGSTGVAAIKHNRRFIGSEISKYYFNISKKRIFHKEKIKKNSESK